MADQITIGADPEFFLADKNGFFASAHSLIPGTKHEPHSVEGGAIQVDGVAAEINTIPARSFSEFRQSIDQLREAVIKHAPGHSVLRATTVQINRQNIPEENLVLSCESDFDSYEQDINPILDATSDYRSAGGHVHIGGIFNKKTSLLRRYKDASRLGRLMDKYVGVYSVIWDKDQRRRETYGKPGAIRVKSYGIEYRTLSNAWLFNEKIMAFVYNQTLKAVEAYQAGEDNTDTIIKSIINSGDKEHKFFEGQETTKEVYACLSA